MTRSRVLAGIGALTVVALIAIPVYAHCGRCAADGKAAATAMDAAKLTLTSAITAAEGHSKGKAVGGWASVPGGKFSGFEVYCMVGDKMMEVTVDATGKATKMGEAKEMSLGDHKAEVKPAPKGG